MSSLLVGTGAYCDIRLTDDESPNGWKYIHANSNLIGFLSGAGSWIFRVDNAGTAIAESSLRAPVFYDYNDTGYYLDPQSASLVYTLRAASYLYVGNGSQMTINNDQIWRPDGGQLHLQYSAGGNINMCNGGGYAYSVTSLRAPIFYDTNNTGYYIDPHSSSQFNVVSLAGIGANTAIGKVHSGSDFANGTLVQTNIWAADWAGASFVMEVTGKSYSSSPPFSFMVQGYLYADTIINCSAINHGTPISYVRVFNYNNYLCFWWPRWGYWNSFEVRVRDAGGDSANRVTSIGDSGLPSGSKMVEANLFNTAMYGYNMGGNLYASVYYDANNTAYYVDPNSGSRTGGINADSLYSYGNVTAYSDERLKKDWENLPANFVEELAKVKSGTYTRIDSGERQVGVGAQSLQSILKEAVSDKEQYLGVNYGNAALASAVELAKEVVDLRNRVAQLESLIHKLIGD
jgi:hypothetical protein